MWWVVLLLPQCGKDGHGPYPQERWFKSEGAQYDPLRHIWFWITQILGVELLSEFSDAYKSLDKMKDLMKKFALLRLKFADAG